MNEPSQHRLTATLHIIMLVALVAAGLSAAAIVAGPAGFGWFGGEPAISGDATVVNDLDDLDDLDGLDAIDDSALG